MRRYSAGREYAHGDVLVLYAQGDLVEGQGGEGHGYNSVEECTNCINRLEFVMYWRQSEHWKG